MGIGAFFGFRDNGYITPTILMVLYILGAIAFVVYGIFEISWGRPWWGLGYIVLGNVFWRVYVELIMVFFNMHENLAKLVRQKK